MANLISIPSSFQGDGISGTAFVAVLAAVILFAALSINLNDRLYPGFPVVGENVKNTQVAKRQWVKSAKSIIYNTLSKAQRPFQTIGSTGPLIILPAHYMDEVRNDDRMTFGGFLKKDFFTTYPGFQGFRPAVDNAVFTTSVRIGLTQAIGQVTEILSQETANCLRDLYPVSDEWRPTHFNQDSLRIIARLSSRIFLPEPLCYDEDWLNIAVDYTVDFFTAAFALRSYPTFLRPFIHRFLPQTQKIRKQVETATRLIEPELARRRKREEEAKRKGIPIERPVDALSWMQTAAEQKGLNYNPVWGELNYSLGAIHTTSMTFCYVVYDLIEHSEYIQLLRDEIATVWKEGDELTKSVLYNLKLMDSFMKESQRLSPVTLLPINRVADETVTLKDGTVIPKGATLGIPITAMTDESVYSNPHEFDGHRFYNLRQQPGNETKYQFVTTSNDHIAFGHGKHACPGRFFASNEIKITLVHLLTKYDLKFPEGQGKPKCLEIGVSMAPDPKAQILYRARK